MIQRGCVPGVPEDEIEAIPELGYEARMAVRAKLLVDVSQRLMAINIIMPYLMPKSSSTEIELTLDIFTVKAEVGRDRRHTRPTMSPATITRQESIARMSLKIAHSLQSAKSFVLEIDA